MFVDCNFIYNNYTFYGFCNNKKGFITTFQTIVEVMSDSLKGRHPKTSFEEVKDELKNYFKYLGQTCKRENNKLTK